MLSESDIRKRELAKARRKRWADKNPGYQAEYRSTDEYKARQKARRAAFYIEHKEQEKAQMRIWRENNKERFRELAREWAQRNKDYERTRLNNKRHKMVGRLSNGIAAKLLVLQRGMCACCRVDITITPYEMDHIEPLKLGGLNVDWNIQLLCASCNSKKSAKQPHKFMQERGFLL